MKTSTEIQSIVDVVGEEKAIEMIAKAGFDAWDFSMFNMKKRMNPFEGLFKKKYALVTNDYLKFARHLKQIGEENGVVCNQSHAPFRHSIKMFALIYSVPLNVPQKRVARFASFTQITLSLPKKMPSFS